MSYAKKPARVEPPAAGQEERTQWPATEELLSGTITRQLDSGGRVEAARYVTSEGVESEKLSFHWVSKKGSDQWTWSGLSDDESYAQGEWKYCSWDDHDVTGRCTPEEWIKRRYDEVVRHDLERVRPRVVSTNLKARTDADVDRALKWMTLFLAADLFGDGYAETSRGIPRFALTVADELRRRGRDKEASDLLSAVAPSLIDHYDYAEAGKILDAIGQRWGREAAQKIVKRWANGRVDESALDRDEAWGLSQHLMNLAPLERWAVPELRYRALLEQSAHVAECLEALGYWQLERGEPREARKVFTRALKAGPGKRHAFILYHLFKANLQLGEKRRADAVVGGLAEAVGRLTLESSDLVAEHQLHMLCMELARHVVERGRHGDALAFTGAAQRVERAHNEDLLDGSPTIVPQRVRGGLWLEATALHLETLMALERFADASDAFSMSERKSAILAAAHADQASVVERILGAGIRARLRASGSSARTRARGLLKLASDIVAEPRAGTLLHALACAYACAGDGKQARLYAQRAERRGIPAATLACDPLLAP